MRWRKTSEGVELVKGSEVLATVTTSGYWRAEAGGQLVLAEKGADLEGAKADAKKWVQAAIKAADAFDKRQRETVKVLRATVRTIAKVAARGRRLADTAGLVPEAVAVIKAALGVIDLAAHDDRDEGVHNAIAELKREVNAAGRSTDDMLRAGKRLETAMKPERGAAGGAGAGPRVSPRATGRQPGAQHPLTRDATFDVGGKPTTIELVQTVVDGKVVLTYNGVAPKVPYKLRVKMRTGGFNEIDTASPWAQKPEVKKAIGELVAMALPMGAETYHDNTVPQFDYEIRELKKQLETLLRGTSDFDAATEELAIAVEGRRRAVAAGAPTDRRPL
jgi:hypothetical protein